MKKILLALMTIAWFNSPDLEAQSTGLEIMHQYEEENKVEDLTLDVDLTIKSKNGRTQNRVLLQEIKATDNCDNCYNSIIKFLKPSDVENTGVLTLEYGDKEDDQWLYLPALQRSRRISANNRKDRFIGTEFTYEDISNFLSENLTEYTYNNLGDEMVDGHDCFQIEAIPNTESEQKLSGYSRRVISITKEHYVIINTLFYDKKGKPLKVMKANDIRLVPDSESFRTYQLELTNLQTNNSTSLVYTNIAIDKGIDSDLFTKRYLEREN